MKYPGWQGRAPAPPVNSVTSGRSNPYLAHEMVIDAYRLEVTDMLTSRNKFAFTMSVGAVPTPIWLEA
jgi:hypothetical protein